MKTFRILVVAAVLLGAGYAIWRFMGAGPAATPETPVVVKAAPAPVAIVAGKSGAIEAPKLPAKVLAPTVTPAAVNQATATVATATDLSNPQPQADLNDCINQSLKLLETKDISNLLKTLMPPDAFQRETANGRSTSYEDLAAQLSQDPNFTAKMNQLQQALESIKGTSPELNTDGTQATFKIDQSIHGGDMVFTKVDGSWYLK